MPRVNTGRKRGRPSLAVKDLDDAWGRGTLVRRQIVSHCWAIEKFIAEGGLRGRDGRTRIILDRLAMLHDVLADWGDMPATGYREIERPHGAAG